MKRKRGNYLLGLLFTIMMMPITVKAEETVTANQKYTVIPLFSESQIAESTNFFDMKLSAGAVEHFQIKIQNLGDAAQEFLVNVNTATTNNNGIVDYTIPEIEKDESMVYPIKELITPNNKRITVEAQSVEIVDFTIAMPDTELEGIFLGGITVTPSTDKTKESGNIQNVFMHTLAVRARTNDDPVSAELLGGAVEIGQKNLHNYVAMEIRNPQAKLMTMLKGTFKITKKGETTAIVSMEKEDLSIAPNSKFQMPIQLNEMFQAGKYTYTIRLTGADGEWEFSKDFTIEKEQASQLNETSVDQKKSGFSNWILYLLLAIAVLLGGFWVYFFGRKKGKRERKRFS